MNDFVLELQNFSVDRGNRQRVLAIDAFAVRRTELVAVVGPNGAGKSTLLLAINLLQPYRGDMRLFGQAIADKTGLRRRSAMVFQETLLLNDSVYNNLAWALKFHGVAEGEIRQQVYDALRDFRSDHLAERSARTLSGGEAQRVCIARALATNPELLLLDEPFAALDAPLRAEMIEEIRQLALKRGMTVLLVSHNFADVLHFADRAVVVIGGSIIQDAKPEMLLRRPVNEQVARLVGMDNMIPCRLEETDKGLVVTMAGGLSIPYHGERIDSVTTCCIPGDALFICDGNSPDESGTGIVLEGQIERIVPDVGSYRMLVRVGGQALVVRVGRRDIPAYISNQDKVKLLLRLSEVQLV
ncbi:MAG: ABC transporter ATP-binding protein [Negativicutes bacterium]|nr:ABC transporter ATP-binding protein [Negativicutes bacterium]